MQGKGYEFINGIVGGSVPREYIPAVDKGIKEAVETGVIAGYPIVDVKVTLFDGSYHDVDSNEMAFKIGRFHGLQGRLPESPSAFSMTRRRRPAKAGGLRPGHPREAAPRRARARPRPRRAACLAVAKR